VSVSSRDSGPPCSTTSCRYERWADALLHSAPRLASGVSSSSDIASPVTLRLLCPHAFALCQMCTFLQEVTQFIRPAVLPSHVPLSTAPGRRTREQRVRQQFNGCSMTVAAAPLGFHRRMRVNRQVVTHVISIDASSLQDGIQVPMMRVIIRGL
jgi:hypothetical protein